MVHPSVTNGKHLDANPHNTAITTYSGLTFDIHDEDEWNFDKFDIAHSLSTINRFAGHVEFYSVAEHSARVADMLKDWGCPPEVQLLGLLHDASEAYLLDIPRPWKGTVYIGKRTYMDVEDDIQAALFEWAGITYAYDNDWDIVKEADMETYRIEAMARPTPSVMGFSPNSMRTEFIWKWNSLEGQCE